MHLSVELAWNVPFVSPFGETGDILGEDVVAGFEILGSEGIPREGDRKGEHGLGKRPFLPPVSPDRLRGLNHSPSAISEGSETFTFSFGQSRRASMRLMT